MSWCARAPGIEPKRAARAAYSSSHRVKARSTARFEPPRVTPHMIMAVLRPKDGEPADPCPTLSTLKRLIGDERGSRSYYGSSDSFEGVVMAKFIYVFRGGAFLEKGVCRPARCRIT